MAGGGGGVRLPDRQRDLGFSAPVLRRTFKVDGDVRGPGGFGLAGWRRRGVEEDVRAMEHPEPAGRRRGRGERNLN